LLESVSRIARKVASAQGVDLYHVELSGRNLRVLIDKETGVPLASCVQFSRALSDELDRADMIGQRYLLEVSSPGVERRLYRPSDYAAAAGRHVVVRTDTQTVEGTLVRANDKGIAVSSGTKDECPETIVDYGEIRSARVKVSDAELFSKQKEQNA